MKPLLALLALTLSTFADNLTHWDLEVDGVKREALIYAPPSAKEKPTPLVFAFHGHGGTAQRAVQSFAMPKSWPEAISVHMQGLNTPGRLTDPQGLKPGWQHGAGAEGNRDLKFFDAILTRLKKDFKIDDKRIYSMGHSNGGGFTYLLWSERGDTFAAVAPSGSLLGEGAEKLKPKPCFHAAGQNDPLVKFEWQKLMMDKVRRLNGCDAEGTSPGPNQTLYASPGGFPVLTYIHSGGHGYPAEIPPLIAKFFQEHPKP